MPIKLRMISMMAKMRLNATILYAIIITEDLAI